MGIGPFIPIIIAQQTNQRMLMNRRRGFLGVSAPKNDDEEQEDRPETPSELDELFNTFLWCMGIILGVPLVILLTFIALMIFG